MAAVYPVQPGAPDYSSTSTNAYIPAIYSALLVKKFYPETVFSKISNTDYEGDIKAHGDTVNIRTRPTIETFKYKKGMVLPVQNPESPYVTLKIDQGEGFSFAIDKVDEFQSDIKLMNAWGEDAAKQMAQVIDRNVLTSIAQAGAIAANASDTTIVNGYANVNTSFTLSKGTSAAPSALVAGGYTARGTAIAAGGGASNATSLSQLAYASAHYIASTGDAIVNKILSFGRWLDENNAPQEGRFVVVPFWVLQTLKQMGNNNFGLAYATGQNSANVLTGVIPKIDRFDIIGSNNLPTTTTGTNGSPIIFGTNYATTFATQITESRIIDNPFAFGKMMQGLQVYGFSAIKQPMIGVDFWGTA